MTIFFIFFKTFADKKFHGPVFCHQYSYSIFRAKATCERGNPDSRARDEGDSRLLNVLRNCCENQSSKGLKYILNDRSRTVHNFLCELKKLFNFVIQPGAEFDEELLDEISSEKEEEEEELSSEITDDRFNSDEDIYV